MYLSIVIISGSLFFSAQYLIVMGKKKTVEVAVSVPVKAEKKKSGTGSSLWSV
jgi:uncharacterized membrane protein (UPF0136 family)